MIGVKIYQQADVVTYVMGVILCAKLCFLCNIP